MLKNVAAKLFKEEALAFMKKIWTNGCYDILHVGHIRLFEFAKSRGDSLIVGIDSDERVRLLKGNSRPINNQTDRVEMLLSNKYVDKVVVFSSEEEMCDLLLDNQISEIVIGNDYLGKKVVGETIVDSVVFFEKIDGYSTTSILREKNGTV